MPLLLLSLLVPLALAAPTAIVPPPRAAALDPVVGLRFAWPVGLACDTVETLTRTGFGEEGDGVVRVLRGLAVSEAPEGLRIRQERLVVEGAISAGATLDLYRPDRLVSADGHFAGIAGMEAHIQAVRTRAALSLARLTQPQKVELGAALNRASDPLALQARMADEWERAVGSWAGLYLSESVSGSSVTNGPAPLFPVGPSVQWFATFRFVERTPCAGESGEPRCLVIAYDAAPWGSGRNAVLAEGARVLLGAPEGEAVTWTQAVLGVRGQLTVDPATLVPVRRMEETRLRAHAAWASGEGDLDLSLRADEGWTCAIRPAPPPPPPVVPPPPVAPPPVAPPPVPEAPPTSGSSG